jgi:hypothetical protein
MPAKQGRKKAARATRAAADWLVVGSAVFQRRIQIAIDEIRL